MRVAVEIHGDGEAGNVSRRDLDVRRERGHGAAHSHRADSRGVDCVEYFLFERRDVTEFVRRAEGVPEQRALRKNRNLFEIAAQSDTQYQRRAGVAVRFDDGLNDEIDNAPLP
jgi:hypothetical protein